MPGRVFISYARTDGFDFANRLYDDLKKHDIDVWMDIHVLAPGSDWDSEIDEGLDWAELLVVVLTPGAVKSRQVKSEWNHMANLGKAIIPLMVLDCRVPRLLKTYNWIDFRHDYDAALHALLPFALDASLADMPTEAITEYDGTFFTMALDGDEPTPLQLSRDITNLQGQIIKGYRLEELVGAGGFGAVYRASQPSIKREVAIKVILPEYVNDPDFIRRFEAEAQIIAHLENLHIVPLYDYWRDASGAYLVMRWLRGGSLKDVLDKGHWPLDDVARVVDQLAQALDVAHRAGVVHRDIKPANVLLDEERNVYLADFGIAKELQDITGASEAIAESEAGGFIGSPDYVSPEQVQQQDITPASDIYSFGIIIYNLLTGEMPFPDADNLSTLISKQLTEPLPDVRDIRPNLPADLNDIIEKATAKDPDERYQNVLDLARDFRRALSQVSDESLGELDQRSQPAFANTLYSGVYGLGADDYAIEPVNPYQGLQAFQEADAPYFKGRDALIQHLLTLFAASHPPSEATNGVGRATTDERSRFLALVGASGSGKSSVVRAGLMPALRKGAVPGSDSWFIVEMIPGAHPLEELEAALLRIAINPPTTFMPQLEADERGLIRAVKRSLPADNQIELLLFIDQFEEVFTQVEDEQERIFFLNSLLAAATTPNSRIRILLTMRADFYDRPLQYAGFGDLLRRTTEVILPLTPEELRVAIEQPARAAGLVLENGLTDAILADVGEQPGVLPLVQYALTELYERRAGPKLTVNAYRDIGGVSGALAQRAEQLYTALNAAQQDAVQQMFLRLVTLGEGVEDTRRRTSMTELRSMAHNETTMQAVVDLFGKYRLLTFDHDPVTRVPTVEVAHEALIRQWGRLRGWLDDNRDDMRTQRRVAQATAEWHAAGHDASFLASGARLQQFIDWMQHATLALTADEQAYIEASRQRRDDIAAQEAARQAREIALEQRSRRFLWALVGVMALAVIVAIGLTSAAVDQSAQAQNNAATATHAQGLARVEADRAATSAAVADTNARMAAQNAGEARRLAFASSAQLALANADNDLALRLALAAYEGIDTTGDDTEANAPRNAQTQRILYEAAYAPGSTRLRFDGHTNRVMTVAVDASGQMALSGDQDNRLLLWDVTTGEIIRQLEGHSGMGIIWDVAFSPVTDGDAHLAASAADDDTIIVWDVMTGEIVHRLAGHSDFVRTLAWSPDGTRLLTGGQDGQIILWDVATGDALTTVYEGDSAVYDVTFSPSGFTALSGHQDGTIRLWLVQSGEMFQLFNEDGSAHSDEIWSLAYLPDESGFMSASQDGTLLLWRFESGQPVQTYLGHSARVTSVELSADGQYAVSGAEDNSIILWDVATGGILQRMNGHDFLVYDVALRPVAGRNLLEVLSASWDGTVRIWTMAHGAQIRQINAAAPVADAVYHPDGTYMAYASGNDISLWEVATADVADTWSGHTGAVNALAYTPDGAYLISAADDETLIVWDALTGEQRHTLNGHSAAVWAVASSPDSRLIASGSRDNTIIVWDVETGEQIERLFGHTFRITDVAFSPDGRRLVSSSFDNSLLMWDVATGDALVRLQGHADWVRSAAFSPDGRRVVSAGADNAVLVWDAEFGDRLLTLEGHAAQVFDAQYTADGAFIVSAGGDNTVLIWDAATGDIVQQLTGHDDAVLSLDLSSDGETVLSASMDGTVREWQLITAPDALRTWLDDNRYLRDFTCAERERYGVLPLCAQPTPFALSSES